ncbi:nucleotide exchange factor GrpE [Sporanaerobium hydrogeniformans]|uniref:Nucleotide exchange factor GrpE n=1 Tax=Sporanaerobium hydrogeniformans TaxID=3072179 RepID=A0AC61DFY7_9FIRM|nr:nucleotide exchange factor GrpE [Sporanaerobium hydrogeniformans]PHV71512.1 nucleotide exchange factor GrpE [Sporanaerobium hydrogeniformans]
MEENKEVVEDIVMEESTVESVEETKSNAEEAETVEETEVVEEKIESEPKDKAAEYLERLQRLMAEFDNYRKRSEKEKKDMYDFAVGNTIQELLPLVDNFERALQVESSDKKFFDGVSMIYKQMMSILETLQVTVIPAVNETFNPNLHNAVFHIEDENVGENIIVEELQKGYLYKEKVVRHSMVKVAN